jgi:hypothetical protein
VEKLRRRREDGFAGALAGGWFFGLGQDCAPVGQALPDSIGQNELSNF